MMTKTLSKTLMAASLVVALGAAGVVPAMATGAAMQSEADTSMATKVSDTWITTKLKSDFATTKGVDVTDVSVDTKAGVVMLTGTVDSAAEKALAVKTARSIKGVKAVEADHLMVRGEHGAMASGHDGMSSVSSLADKANDTWITAKLKSSFATTKGVDVTHVSVDTKAGVVMLTGTVDSQAEKTLAIQTARSIKGVKAVEADHLRVGAGHDAMESGHDGMSSGTSMGTKVSDTWITTKVKSEFAMTKGVSFGDISVDTKAGVVMLSGEVDSASEKALAIKSARSIKGVRAVEAGGLTVRQGSK